MKAVILAAGLGTRLRPLTEAVPKALVPVLHRPALLRVADRLRAAGVATLCVNAHHHAEQVARALPEAVVHVEPVILDSGGGIANFKRLLQEDEAFLVHNCDVYSTFDLRALLRHHQEHRPAATLALTRNPATDKVLLHPDGCIANLGEVGPGRFTYAGIAVLTPEVLARLEPGRPASLPDVLRALLQSNRSLRGYLQPDAAWNDLGSPRSYLELHRDLLTGRLPWPDPGDPERPWSIRATVPGDVVLRGWGVVSQGARVHPGAVLEDSVLLDGAEVRGVLRHGIAGPGFVLTSPVSLPE